MANSVWRRSRKQIRVSMAKSACTNTWPSARFLQQQKAKAHCHKRYIGSVTLGKWITPTANINKWLTKIEGGADRRERPTTGEEQYKTSGYPVLILYNTILYYFMILFSRAYIVVAPRTIYPAPGVHTTRQKSVPMSFEEKRRI